MQAQQDGGAVATTTTDAGTHASTETGGGGGGQSTTFTSSGALPKVAAGSGNPNPNPSASDLAYGFPEVATAQAMLAQAGGPAGDVTALAPIVKRVLEAAQAASQQPKLAVALMGVLKPYDKLPALAGPIHEMQARVETLANSANLEDTAAKTAANTGPAAQTTPITGTPIDAELTTGSFLGLPANKIHPALLERLGKAEAHLAGLVGKSGAELAKELGVHPGDPYRIWRKPPGGYHCFGLAIDINYDTNPYIGGQSGGASDRLGDAQAMAAIYHACLLTGRGEPMSPADSTTRAAKESTQVMWQHFDEASKALEAYLAATPSQVAAWIAAGNLSRALKAPAGVPVDEARLRTADADAWLAQIKLDMDNTHGVRSTQSNWWKSGAGQRSKLGFMDLDERLVVALRDVAGLGWGAVDLGGENGDMQHFDCRHDYSYATLKAALHELDHA